MPDDQRQGSKVYCLSLRPREMRSVVEALTAPGESTAPRHCAAERCSLSAQRQGRKVHCLPLPAPQRRGVLQLIRAAPRVEGAGVMPDDQSQRRGVLQLIRAAPRAEGTVSALSACKAPRAASCRRSGPAGGRSNGPSRLWRGRLPNLPFGTRWSWRRLDSPVREALFRRGSRCHRREQNHRCSSSAQRQGRKVQCLRLSKAPSAAARSRSAKGRRCSGGARWLVPKVEGVLSERAATAACRASRCVAESCCNLSARRQGSKLLS